jgi:transcriptional regulator with XRE-family HTH domain
MATSNQLRAARALLGLSQPEVAAAAGVSSMTVKRAEGSGKPAASADAIAAIRSALEAAGAEFTDGRRPGVRIRKGAPHAD